MAKQLNPLPPSAITARRAIWVQSLLALLLGGGIALAQAKARNLVPAVIEDNAYRAAVALAIGAVVLLLLSFLMRYQWRVLWIVLLLIEVGTIAGLVWTNIQGFNLFAVVGLLITPVVALSALLNRVTRRWFSH